MELRCDSSPLSDGASMSSRTTCRPDETQSFVSQSTGPRKLSCDCGVEGEVGGVSGVDDSGI